MVLTPPCSIFVFQQLLVLLMVANLSSGAMIVYVDPDPDSYVISEKKDDYFIPTSKRSGVLMIQPELEDVCQTKVIGGHRPHFGHLLNGSRVEIQQDNHYDFMATFVECVYNDRPSCHGIDTKRFSSECVTVFENRSARVRLALTSMPFTDAHVRVPIACQCRLRRIPSIFQR